MVSRHSIFNLVVDVRCLGCLNLRWHLEGHVPLILLMLSSNGTIFGTIIACIQLVEVMLAIWIISR
jgi:hypothetical protein